jgi:hypothetical protein
LFVQPRVALALVNWLEQAKMEKKLNTQPTS